MNFWVALDEVTPEMGSMRFVSGAHREGPLGRPAPDESRHRWEPRDTLEEYPKLLELYELSPPLHYQQGDATVHDGWMIHSAPPNESDRERWCYIAEFAAADVRWRDGKVFGKVDTSAFLNAETYPVVYPSTA